MKGYPDNQIAFDHARLTAQRSGADLARAVVEGWLRRDELAAIVATCEACAAGFPCETPARGGNLDACANAPVLGALSLQP